MKKGTISLLSLLLVAAAACAPSVSQQGREELKKDVNCKTARNDIKVLEAERATTADRVRSGVRSIAPAAAVAGLLRGRYGEEAEVATGQYNRDISEKIAQIKKTCKIS